MKKIKNLNNSSLVNPATSFENKRVLVLKDLPDSSRECKLCRGVNDNDCDICGETLNPVNDN